MAYNKVGKNEVFKADELIAYMEQLTAKFGILDDAIKILITNGKTFSDTIIKGGNAKEVSDAATKLKDAASELDAVEKERIKTQKQLETVQAKIILAQSEETKELNKQKQVLNDINKEQKLNNKLIDESLGDLERLNAETAKLTKERNKMRDITGKNKDAFEELSKKLADNIKKQKEFGKEIGRNQLEVGNYKEQIKEALGEVDLFDNALGNVTGQLRGVAGGVAKFAKSFKTLKGALISTGIGALVVALGSLITYFQKSEKGVKQFAKISAGVGAIFDKLVSVFAKLGEGIFDLFSKPQETIAKFGSLIKENLINRFVALGNIIKKITKFEFKGLGDEFATLATGVEDVGSKMKSFGSEIVEAANKGAKLKDLEFRFKAINRLLSTQITLLNGQKELQNAIADDNTRSFKERENAAEKALDLLEKQAAKELQLAQNAFTLLDKEVAIRKANGEFIEDLLDQRTDALNAVKEAENSLLLAEFENEKTRRELKQDRLERDLDILLDGYDNQKTINERIIADDTRTFNERSKLLEQTRQLGDASFAKQIETIEQFTDASVNANDLLATSDAIALNEKIRNLGLSEIVEGRLLEIIRDRRTEIQDLSETERDLIASQQVIIQKDVDTRGKAFSEMQATEKAFFEGSIIERKKAGESEKSIILSQKEFELKQAKEKFEFLLENSENLSDLQIQNAKNTIAAIELEMQGIEKGGGGESKGLKNILSDMTGIPEKGIEEIASFTGQAIDMTLGALGDYYAQKQEMVQQDIANRDANIDSLNSEIDAELNRIETLKEAGKAYSEDTLNELKSKLAQEEEAKSKSQKESDKIAKRQFYIDQAIQASALVTSVSQIFAGFTKIPVLGWILGAAAVASFLVSFAQTKKNLTAKKAKKGAFIDRLGGESHEKGGSYIEPANIEAEKNEGMAIYPVQMMNREGGAVKELNQGLLQGKYTATELLKSKYSNTNALYNSVMINQESERVLPELEKQTRLLNKMTIKSNTKYLS